MGNHIADRIAHAARNRYPELFSSDAAAPGVLVLAIESVLCDVRHETQYEPWTGYPGCVNTITNRGNGISARARIAREHFGTLDRDLLAVMVADALAHSPRPEDVLARVVGLIQAAMGVADAMSLKAENSLSSSPQRWQDVLTILLADDEYREVVDALTVDGVVLVDLVTASFG
jgi:hypothetical protein